MRVYTFDIDWHDDVEIENIHRLDLYVATPKELMEDFHCGMPDLIYDRDVPDNFGKK